MISRQVQHITSGSSNLTLQNDESAAAAGGPDRRAHVTSWHLSLFHVPPSESLEILQLERWGESGLRMGTMGVRRRPWLRRSSCCSLPSCLPVLGGGEAWAHQPGTTVTVVASKEILCMPSGRFMVIKSSHEGGEFIRLGVIVL